jgi:hypothetical protein
VPFCPLSSHGGAYCSVPRAADPLPAPAAAPEKVCGTCTFLNPASRVHCEMCDSPL